MSAPFRSGDSLLCWRRPTGPLPSCWQPGVGVIYTAIWVDLATDGSWIVGLLEEPADDNFSGWEAEAFRRIEPGVFDLREQMRSLGKDPARHSRECAK